MEKASFAFSLKFQLQFTIKLPLAIIISRLIIAKVVTARKTEGHSRVCSPSKGHVSSRRNFATQ